MFVIQSLSFTRPDISDAIRRAIAAVSPEAEIQSVDQFAPSGLLNRRVHNQLAEADLVIADVTGSTPNVMYELGLATAANKPLVIIANSSSSIPFDIAGFKYLVYDETDRLDQFVDLLAGWARHVLEDPNWVRRDRTRTSQQSAFISYSHVDSEFLDRLLVHLRPLQMSGALEIWVDTQLRAGDKWKEEIDAALAKASIAVLLISADFLASDFIVRNELPPLLKRAESQGTRIVPVILKPCRFARDPHLSSFHAINDPRRPVAGLPEVESEAVFDSVAEAVERLLGRNG